MSDPKQATDFLEKIREKVKATTEARLLCLISIATIKLRVKDLEGTKVKRGVYIEQVMLTVVWKYTGLYNYTSALI